MDVLSGIFGALGAGLGALNNLSARKREERARKWEAEQNEKNRKWQEKMYKQQVANQREDAATARSWNSPVGQMQRLQAAGLNADMMYSNGATQPAAVSGSYSQPSGAGTSTNAVSAIASTPAIGDSMLRGIEAMRTLAETSNIQEDTNKKRGEITALDLDNFVKAATQGKQIELAGMQVTLAKKAADLSDAQRSNLIQTLNNLQTQNELVNQKIQESMALTRNLDSQTLNNRITAYLSGPRFDMEVKEFQQRLRESDSRIEVNSAQAKEILTLVLAKKLNLDADTLFKKANVRKTNFDAANSIRTGNILNIQAKQLQFNYGQSLKYDDAERISNIAGCALGSVGQIAADILLFKGLGTGRQIVRGFGR